jgi:tetratricopeptide (TPR) repeat protein
VQVLASGQAGLFAVQTAKGYLVERLDTGERHEAGSREIAYYFAGCNDVTQLTVRNANEARAATELAWSGDRSVRLFVMLLDPVETHEDLVEVGEVLEELIGSDEVVERVEAQLFSAPLPHPVDVTSVMTALADAPRSRILLDRFLGLQSIIARTRSAFDLIEDEAFESAQHRRKFLEEAIDRGCVRALVLAAAGTKGIESALFQLYSQLKGLENNREIIQRWTQSFGRTHYELAPLNEPEEARMVWSGATAAGGHQAFERALQQQAAIVDRIRAADFETARRYANDLVTDQRRTSSPEHIAKSLTNLSQRAKLLEVLDLALEWAFAAVQEKGDDPMTHAQLADVLMRVGRYTEAHQSLDLAQSFGEAGFAASGRARILRYRGDPGTALEAHSAALARYEYGDDRAQFDLAGIAECLRDMERLDEALDAYDMGLKQCPYAAALHAGRAATLGEMGRFEEALEGYRTAMKLDGEQVVPRNGIASLYRRAGEFERAEADLREIINDFPFDIHSRGGLVATLRDVGRFDEAVAAAEALVEHLPASPDALWTLADAQIDARQFEEATQTLQAAIEDFRHSAGLRNGLARVEKAKGHYAAALALYDDAARDFPSNSRIQLNRADMLRRLGNLEEALRIYEGAMTKHPHWLMLKNAVASIYIYQRRFEEALSLLKIDDPRTADEWRNFALHGMLDSAAGAEDAARERFEWGAVRCPFRRERHMLRAGLARLQIRAGAVAAAAATAQECTGDVTELVKFHAIALQTDKGPARTLYEHLLKSYLPEPYHELRDEIARQCDVVDLPSVRTQEWLLDHEGDALLLEAA